MPTQPFDQLLTRYLDDSLSEEEFEYLKIIVAVSGEEALEKALARVWGSYQARHKVSPERSKEMLQHILLAEPVTIPSINSKRKIFHINFRWKVAVAMLLVIGAATWFTASRWKNTDSKVATTVIEPGHAGAILTLSDGRTIILDSMPNGVVEHQGSATLHISDSQLVYNNGQEDGTVLYNTITTPRGRQYSLLLPDSTRVWLNAASSLTYPTAFAGNDRRVRLTGEAYFEVKKNQHRSFIVEVNGIKEVEVLGTKFNINAYGDNDQCMTTLFEGKVKVKANGKELLVAPGQQAVLNSTDSKNRILSLELSPDLEQVIAWKEGLFNFTHANLNTVLQQLARWYDLEIEYTGAIPVRRFGGGINMNLSLEQALLLLSDMNLQYKLEQRKLIIYP